VTGTDLKVRVNLVKGGEGRNLFLSRSRATFDKLHKRGCDVSESGIFMEGTGQTRRWRAGAQKREIRTATGERKASGLADRLMLNS